MYNKFKKLEFTDDFMFRKVMKDKRNFNIQKKSHGFADFYEICLQYKIFSSKHAIFCIFTYI